MHIQNVLSIAIDFCSYWYYKKQKFNKDEMLFGNTCNTENRMNVKIK